MSMSSGSRFDETPIFERVDVMGTRIHNISSSTAIDRMIQIMDDGRRCIVLSVNAHLLNLVWDNDWLHKLFSEDAIVLCDSVGAQLAGLLLNRVVTIRNTPPDWIDSFGRRLAEQNRSVFWFGGKSDVVELAAKNFHRRTGARVAGFHHGILDFSAGSVDSEAVLRSIDQAGPDALIVCLGMPLQEQWLHQNWHRLNTCVAITGGALVDHMAGRVRRPSRWVTNCGLEWVSRLIIDPRRLWRRYILGLPRFGVHLLHELVLKRHVRLGRR
jgi:N-acetylglucosaminyldiphosphoundecaprenol N-acetyl-beta-D-mannosaminyltransferase